MSADEPGPATVRRCLQDYADRGVFRGYSERPEQAGRIRFRFAWLARHPYDLRYDGRRGSFTFLNALPNIAGRSPIARALRAFVGERSDDSLPPHRRIDPHRATASAYVERGAMRLRVVARAGHHAYGANRAVNLMHEVYLYLHRYFPEYMWENYDAPQD